MRERVGVILLDGNDVIVRIYEIDANNRWTLIRYREHKLIPLTQEETVTTDEIIEVIADTSFSQYAIHVSNWKIIARNSNKETIQHVSQATGLPSEVLTSSREQELLCKGLLPEFL